MDGWRPTDTTPAPRLQPLAALTNFAVVTLVIALVMQVVQLAFFGVAGRFARMQTTGIEEALTFAVVGMIGSVVAILQVVAALMWMFRASSNVTARGLTDRTWGPGWAVGAWFIPLANAFLGFFALFEIWRGSQPEATPDNWRRIMMPAWIHAWWGLYILYTFASIGLGIYSFIVAFSSAFAAAMAGNDPATPQAYMPLQVAMLAVYVVAGALFIRFMLRVRRLQDEPETMPAAPF